MGWKPVLTHPLIPALILIGLSAIFWAVAGSSWSRSRLWVAMLWTTFAMGLLIVARTRLEIAVDYHRAIDPRSASRP
ncbi:hypothetical protein [Tautonia plasticadhaerens]|nr:hypothetical protein [Tautonia plasticadhaerens]